MMNREYLSLYLRAEMAKRGWTIMDLAAAAGVPFETARQQVQGLDREPSLRTASKLLAGVDAQLTIGPADKPKPADKAPRRRRRAAAAQ